MYAETRLAAGIATSLSNGVTSPHASADSVESEDEKSGGLWSLFCWRISESKKRARVAGGSRSLAGENVSGLVAGNGSSIVHSNVDNRGSWGMNYRHYIDRNDPAVFAMEAERKRQPMRLTLIVIREE